MRRRSAFRNVITALAARAAGGLLVVFGVSVLIFVLARAMPGDPARLALGPAATAAQVEALRADMGLDQPLLRQYVTFVAGALRLDFGTSLFTNRPVSADLAYGLPASIELALSAGLVMTVFGVLLGVVSARFQNRWPDNVSRILSLVAVAMPNFVWALILMLLFAYWVELLPVSGRLSEGLPAPPFITGLVTVDATLAGQWATLGDALRHLALPAVSLSLPGLAQVARLTRTNMVDVYARPYTEFARAYGFTERAISMKWALRPALIPTFTLLGMQIVSLLGNAFLVETVFAWPGMARYGVEAILRKDLNAIVAVVLVVSVAFVTINIAIDLCVAFIDPRIRLHSAR